MIDHTNINICVACSSSNIATVLDLGKQPLANNFIDRPQKQTEYPLALNRCMICGHLQLSVNVDREKIFSNYIYRSGTTRTLKSYFDWFAKFITERHGVGRILDVACNDGSQLDSFRELGWETFGVDPAENISQFNTHSHRVAFFDESCLDLGRFDVIIAQNVLAHTDNPRKILDIASQLSDSIYIQTSQATMIERTEFDTIYHEHISFFSPSSMSALANSVGLGIKDIIITPIHGNSFVFHLIKGKTEIDAYTWSYDDVVNFSNRSLEIIHHLRSELSCNPDLIGYGAAAKAMTVLNAVKLGPEYIIDDAKEKQNMFTPGLNIPIVSSRALDYEKDSIKLIPLAWNFVDEIVERVREKFSGEIKVLRYFPQVKWEK